MNKRTTIDKFISNLDRNLHHLNLAFTILFATAYFLYSSYQLIDSKIGAAEIIYFLMINGCIFYWTYLLLRISIEEEANHKAQLRGDSDEK